MNGALSGCERPGEIDDLYIEICVWEVVASLTTLISRLNTCMLVLGFASIRVAGYGGRCPFVAHFYDQPPCVNMLVNGCMI